MGLTVESRVKELIQIIQKKTLLDLNNMNLVFSSKILCSVNKTLKDYGISNNNII